METADSDVIEKWNTRPIEDRLRAEIEQLNKALDEIASGTSHLFAGETWVDPVKRLKDIARAARELKGGGS